MLIRSLIRIFFLVFVYFLIWAVIKPPFQAPDEFQHSFKAFSVTREPWLAQENPLDAHLRFINPLTHDPLLGSVPFHPEVTLEQHDIFLLKTQTWGHTGSWSVGKVPSSAFNYPSLYYLPVFALGQGVTELMSLTPYQSIFMYRFATAFLAAMLWTWVYLVLQRTTPYCNAVFLVVLLNPMLAFMSSSINPDAMLYPLSALTILYSFKLFFERDSIALAAWASISACALTKSTALVMYPTLAMLSGLIFFLRKQVYVLRTFSVVALSLLAVYALFYAWATPTSQALAAQNLKGLNLSVWEYLNQRTFWFLWESYWGNLGWLDYRLSDSFYSVLNWILVANLIWALWHWRKWLQHSFAWYALAFAAIYSAGTFAVEYRLLPVTGWVLQGRYFLPISLGFAMLLLAHEGRLVKWSLVIYLAVFNVAFMGQTVTRYYDGDWTRLWRALPFTAAIDSTASLRRELQTKPPARLPTATQQGFVDDIRIDRNKVMVRGWAPLQDHVAGQVITVHTQHMPLSLSLKVELRPDVAAALNNPAYARSGFLITLIYPDNTAAQKASSELLCVAATDEHGTVFLLASKNKECSDFADGKKTERSFSPEPTPDRPVKIGYHAPLPVQFAGVIDTLEVEGEQLTLTGWVPWRAQDGRQTFHVLAGVPINDAQLVSIMRPDVVRHLGSDDYLSSGFKILLRLDTPLIAGAIFPVCIVASGERGSDVTLQNPKSPGACAMLADKIRDKAQP